MTMKKRTKGCLVAAGIVTGALLVGIAALILVFLKYSEHARRAWKEKALPEIASRAEDDAWLSAQIELLGNPDAGYEQGVIAQGWLTDGMILMGSGEWLVYKSHCSKAPPHIVRDICLAKGSDGKWYYTTCHFCVGMVALLMMQEEQPPDLEFFVKRYHLREFDGRSDECLKETKSFPDDL
jgi:hypothetical protein